MIHLKDNTHTHSPNLGPKRTDVILRGFKSFFFSSFSSMTSFSLCPSGIQVVCACWWEEQTNSTHVNVDLSWAGCLCGDPVGRGSSRKAEAENKSCCSCHHRLSFAVPLPFAPLAVGKRRPQMAHTGGNGQRGGD